MTSTPFHLLVVDDNEDNLFTLTQRLKREGYVRITTATQGDLALSKMRQETFDLVLLDIMMPVMDGFEVLRTMKSDSQLRDIPVIVISAVEDLTSVVVCIQLGAEDYLTKPFSPVLLRARIGACLEKKRLRDLEKAYREELEQQVAERTRQLSQEVEEHRRAEEKLRTLFEAVEHSQVAVVITDAHFVIEYVNPRFFTMTGYSPLDVIGQKFHTLEADCNPPDVFRNLWQTVIAGHVWKGELRNRRKDGQWLWELASISPIHNRHGVITHFVAVKEDITERKRAEARLQQLAAIVESSDDAIIGKDCDGFITSWNAAAERAYGYPATEIIGQASTVLIPPERHAQWQELLDTVRRGQHLDQIETQGRRKDGSLMDVLLTLSPIRDGGGQIIGISTIARDITERKRHEDLLRQVQKIEALGQLTGGVAHDFNNLLAVILGNLEMLESLIGNDRNGRDLVERAIRACEKGAHLTHRLLAFSRRQALAPKVVNLNRLVKGMLELLRRTLGEAVVVRQFLFPDLWEVNVDPNQMENALINLAVNARDAMPNGGTLTFETSNVRLDEDYARQHDDVTAGDYVLLAVSDTGVGMSPHVVARAFDPFFTTKGPGKGSGLGLSMVYGFVKQSEGHIKIYSEIGHGTTIKLYLPKANSGEAALLVPEIPFPVTDAPCGDEVILVVEDDVEVRQVAVNTLRRQGYQVVEATDGPEALRCLEKLPRLDLLFTDVVLPGNMNGAKLAHTLQRLRPDLKVLYTTGYAENAISHSGHLDEGVQLISKPYRQEALIRKVRAVLDNGA